MKGKSIALLLLALGCGLVASVGITQVLAKRDSGPPADTTTVYVSVADLATGSLITRDDLKAETWPKDRVPAGAAFRPEDIEGRRTRQIIYAGEPLIDRKLLTRGEVPTDDMVPKGLRVVAVGVNAEAILNGLVLPGSRCDIQVFLRADPKLGIGETLCKTILQDIRVFAVNDVTSTKTGDPKDPELKSIPGKTVSLLVTPTQAQIVTLAGQLGSIRLVLRGGDDKDQPKTEAMTAHELMGAAGGGDRAKENPKEEEEKRFREMADMIRKSLHDAAIANPARPAPSENEQHFTMRVRCGLEVNDVVLVNNSGVQGMPGDEGVWTATGMGPSMHGKAAVDSHGTKSVDMGPVGPAVGPPPAGPPAGPSAPPAGAANPPLSLPGGLHYPGA